MNWEKVIETLDVMADNADHEAKRRTANGSHDIAVIPATAKWIFTGLAESLREGMKE